MLPAYYFGGMLRLWRCKAIPEPGGGAMIPKGSFWASIQRVESSAGMEHAQSSRRGRVFHITSQGFDVGTSQNPSVLMSILNGNKIRL